MIRRADEEDSLQGVVVATPTIHLADIVAVADETKQTFLDEGLVLLGRRKHNIF